MKLVIAGPAWHSVDYFESLRERASGDPAIVFAGEVDEDTLEALLQLLRVRVAVRGGGDVAHLVGCDGVRGLRRRQRHPRQRRWSWRERTSVQDEDLTAKLDALVADPNTAQAYRTAAGERMTSKYDWDIVTRQWVSLYRSMMW